MVALPDMTFSLGSLLDLLFTLAPKRKKKMSKIIKKDHLEIPSTESADELVRLNIRMSNLAAVSKRNVFDVRNAKMQAELLEIRTRIECDDWDLLEIRIAENPRGLE